MEDVVLITGSQEGMCAKDRLWYFMDDTSQASVYFLDGVIKLLAVENVEHFRDHFFCSWKELLGN